MGNTLSRKEKVTGNADLDVPSEPKQDVKVLNETLSKPISKEDRHSDERGRETELNRVEQKLRSEIWMWNQDFVKAAVKSDLQKWKKEVVERAVDEITRRMAELIINAAEEIEKLHDEVNTLKQDIRNNSRTKAKAT